MNNIQSLRRKKGISQEKVAEELGVDRSTVAKWENGQSKPKVENLVRLSKFFDCTIDDLLK